MRCPYCATILTVLMIALISVQHAEGQACTCSDIAPSDFYTCEKQKSLGQCNAISGAAPGVPEGFCQRTCGRCTCTASPSSSSITPTTPSPSTTTSSPAAARPTACTCTDSQPDSKYTCAQQKSFGKCGESFVGGKGHCQTTCGQCKCNPSCKCDDVQPSGSFTCAQQKFFGQCSAGFMKKGSTAAPVAPNGYCRITCGSCSCQPPPPPPSTRSPASPASPLCVCSDTPPDSSHTCSQQKGFGACSADFMTKTSSTNPNGFCASTCGRCKCNAASTRPTSPSSASAVNSPLASPNSPENGPSSPRAAGVTSSAAAPAPPQPLSAAFVANCECSDVPPDGTTCASVLSSGRCNTYGILVGSTAHPEGFCQRACNHCGNYCIPKNGRSIPAGSRSSGRPSATSSKPPPSSGKCTDTPPSSQYSCAQQKSFGKCAESFMTKGNFCARTCGRCK